MHFTLEMVFELQAAKCDIINSEQLQKILVMERGKRFDRMLVNDLVDDFGSNGFVNFDQFCQIWFHLQTIRDEFEQYAKRGLLSPKKFARFLIEQLGSYIHKITIDSLIHFYKNQLTFDVCVHALKHLANLKNEYCLQTMYITFDYYCELVKRPAKPSAPFLDEPPSYDEVMSW